MRTKRAYVWIKRAHMRKKTAYLKKKKHMQVNRRKCGSVKSPIVLRGIKKEIEYISTRNI